MRTHPPARRIGAMASEATPAAEPVPVGLPTPADPPPASGPARRAETAAALEAGHPGVRARLVRSGRWIARRSPAAAGVLLVALSGGIMGAELAPSTSASIGPLQAKVRVIPSVHPGVH